MRTFLIPVVPMLVLGFACSDGDSGSSFDELVHPCKEGTTEIDKEEMKLGEYSLACEQYMRQCTRGAWFYDAGREFANSFRDETVEDWMPNGIANGLVPPPDPVNEKALRLQEYFDNEIVDASHAKSLSVGFRHHTYIGVYNCETEFQKESADTGCPLYKLLYPFSVRNTYLGVVRNYAEEEDSCRAVRPSDEGGLTSSEGNFTGTTQDSFEINCFPDFLTRDKACAFEIWSMSPFGYLFDWTYLCTQKQDEFSFDPVYRPWYVEAKREYDTVEAASGEPVFMPPYENYGTGQPIFGTTTPFEDTTEEYAGAVLAIEYMIDEPVYKDYIPQCDSRSRDFDPDYSYYEPNPGSAE